jgi:hypothetical protein
MKRRHDKRTKTALGASWLAIAALAIVDVGCGHASAPQGKRLYATSARGRAALYLGVSPDRPHREIGLVQAFGDGNRSHATDVLHSLRRAAQRMGCDAVSNVDVVDDGRTAQAVGLCVRWL